MSESLTIACPQCNQLNRVPKSKLAENGKCGVCKTSLICRSPITITHNSFTSHIVKSDLPVLVDFWAPWCGPCKMMAPVLEEAAQLFSPNIRVAKINTEEEQALATQYNIRSIPTLAIFHKGKEIDRIAGAMAINQLTHWVNNTINKI